MNKTQTPTALKNHVQKLHAGRMKEMKYQVDGEMIGK